jgi:hypothetical protein
MRNDNIIVDLKTSRDVSLWSWERSTYDFKYHIQAAWYIDGLEKAGFKIQRDDGGDPMYVTFVIENEPPYNIGVYQIMEPAVELGRMQYKRYLDLYMWCLTNNSWPAYYGNYHQESNTYRCEIIKSSVPGYAFHSQELQESL